MATDSDNTAFLQQARSEGPGAENARTTAATLEDRAAPLGAPPRKLNRDRRRAPFGNR